MPTLASEDSPSSLGGGVEEVIITKLSISPKQSLHNNEEVHDRWRWWWRPHSLASSSADALYSKTRNFNQEQYTPRHDYSHAMPTQPCEILKKGA